MLIVERIFIAIYVCGSESLTYIFSDPTIRRQFGDLDLLGLVSKAIKIYKNINDEEDDE